MSQDRMQVMTSCDKEWTDVKKVKFLDIEEDDTGRDVVTYICPKCGETHKSIVVRR